MVTSDTKSESLAQGVGVIVGVGRLVGGIGVSVAVGGRAVAVGGTVGVMGVTEAAAVLVSRAAAVCARLVARSLTDGLLLLALPHAINVIAKISPATALSLGRFIAAPSEPGKWCKTWATSACVFAWFGLGH
jgi:hypothetical protein